MNDTQKKLISATENLLQKKGLARLTTRAIAGEAGVAEGLIYHHFKDKAELVFAVVEQSMNETKNLLEKLPLRVGLGKVGENLEEVLQIAYKSYYQIIPVICSVFADHQLHAGILEIIKERQLGPQLPIETMAQYLAAEQRMGRIAADIEPMSAAKLLWMMSFGLAMNDQFMWCEFDISRAGEEIHKAIRTMLIGMEPALPAKRKAASRKRKTS